MKIRFPYKDVPPVDIPAKNLLGIFEAETPDIKCSEEEIIRGALRNPIGSGSLQELARGKSRVLIIVDDISRPTPVYKLIPHIVQELFTAGVKKENIEFLLALGSHRPMSREEMVSKLGRNIVNHYQVSNHDWGNENELKYMGDTEQGVPVWVNKKVSRADLVIGVGRIMPIDICGFTGGGKIVIPGVCGKITNEKMHWVRVDIPNEDIIGLRDNSVRESIDKLSRKAGLNFILNIVMTGRKNIVGAFAGDMVEAHRRGAESAKSLHRVRIPQFADIVIADSHPFDIEFWQANKALDTCGLVVKKGGVIILISPCYEGFSRVHDDEILRFGYRSVKEIKKLVMNGSIKNLVGVHMIQVAQAAIEKAKCILVTDGISEDKIRQTGLDYAKTPSAALEKAFGMVGHDARIAVLRYAAEMLPEIG